MTRDQAAAAEAAAILARAIIALDHGDRVTVRREVEAAYRLLAGGTNGKDITR